MKKYITLFAALMASMLLWSCEEEIEIELDEADQKVVIEGWVTDLNEPHQFKVSRTMSYFGHPQEIPVSGAQLVLRDDFGGIDTLVGTRTGYYESRNLPGVIGRSYTIDVTVDGTMYTASNKIKRINPIAFLTSFYSDTIVFGEGHYVIASAVEEPGIGDYYQFRMWRNDSLFDDPSDIFISDDRLVDGENGIFLYPYPHEVGDTVVVEVRSITNFTYDYYITYFQQLNTGGGPFSPPANNLLTNFNNGALGIMGACGVVRDTIVIQ